MRKKERKLLAERNGKNIKDNTAFFEELDRDALMQVRMQLEDEAWEIIRILNTIGDHLLTAQQSKALIEAGIM